MGGQIRLFGAIAVRPAIVALLPRFAAATGCTVLPRWELNPVVRRQIETGEPFDQVITNPNYVEDLAALGKVLPASQVPFGRIAMGVAARAGSPTTDLAPTGAFRDALLGAQSIAYASEGSSGAYFVSLLERLGIAGEVRPRLVPISGGQTTAAVAGGEAELGVVPVTSIIAAAPEVILLGRFPAELQSYIDFAIGISAEVADAEAARQLSDFLTSAEIDAALAASGIERF